MKASLISQNYVPVIWDQIKGYVDKAVATSSGRYTEQDLFLLCYHGARQLWVAYTEDDIFGFVTTHIVLYPNKKFLSLEFCGGERMAEWKEPLHEMLEMFARENQCHGMEMSGRVGWTRALKDFGWNKLCDFYEVKFDVE